jgi:hypothetical protein
MYMYLEEKHLRYLLTLTPRYEIRILQQIRDRTLSRENGIMQKSFIVVKQVEHQLPGLATGGG